MYTAIKYLRVFLVTAVLAAGAVGPAQAVDDDEKLLKLPAPISKMTPTQWDAFGDNLVKALASDHEGLQQGAMRLALQYSDYVSVRPAIIDLMRIYREHPDNNVRRMAIVTLGSTGSHLALHYLILHEPFESSVAVKRTMRAVIAANT